MSSELADLHAEGDRVRVSTVRSQDIAPFRRALEQSRQRLARWNPVDPDDLERQLPRQSRDHRTFLIHANTPEGDHDLVGKINISDVVRGRFDSAALGYDAYDPYAGRGLFAEGLRLVVNLAFMPEIAGGMGLHRIVAAVQPGNLRSAGLLRSLGFQREGLSRRMLWLPGADGSHGWQDHVSYVALREEWPARPYAPPRVRKVVVLVNGGPGSGSRALARQLALELRIPLFSKDVITEQVANLRPVGQVAHEGGPESVRGDGTSNALWMLLQDSPVGGVVEGWFHPDDALLVVAGLRRCGLDPAAVPEVWCSGAPVVSAQPLGLGPTLTVDTRHDVGDADIVRIALQVSEGTLLRL